MLEGSALEADDENSSEDRPWSVTITGECVRAATTMMDYLIKQKLIMMDTDEIGPDEPAAVDISRGTNSNGDRLRKLLTLMTEDDDGHISPSKVAQHICAPTDGKYTVTNALKLFDCAQQLGFGVTVDQMTSTNRKVKKFRKRPYDLLSVDARKSLRDIRVTEDLYRSSFKSAQSSSSSSDDIPSV